ncbi:hypothetical protein LXL04_007136 [Taraxacum kok-saghyz]
MSVASTSSSSNWVNTRSKFSSSPRSRLCSSSISYAKKINSKSIHCAIEADSVIRIPNRSPCKESTTTCQPESPSSSSSPAAPSNWNLFQKVAAMALDAIEHGLETREKKHPLPKTVDPDVQIAGNFSPVPEHPVRHSLTVTIKIDYDVLMGTPTVQALKSVARDGRTVISSIHQRSSKVFALFDDLFFAESGFPCPTKRNPSDHFLRLEVMDLKTCSAEVKVLPAMNKINGLVLLLALAEGEEGEEEIDSQLAGLVHVKNVSSPASEIGTRRRRHSDDWQKEEGDGDSPTTEKTTIR